MRLFLGDQYLRLQTPLNYASDDMDDASRGNIRNLKQNRAELIKCEKDALDHFMRLTHLDLLRMRSSVVKNQLAQRGNRNDRGNGGEEGMKWLLGTVIFAGAVWWVTSRPRGSSRIRGAVGIARCTF